MCRGGELYESLRKYFAQDADYSGRLASLDGAAAERTFNIDSRETASRLSA